MRDTITDALAAYVGVLALWRGDTDGSHRRGIDRAILAVNELESENKRLREALKGVLDVKCACVRCTAAREALKEET